MSWTFQSSTTEVEDSIPGRGIQMSPLQQGLLWVEQDSTELDALQIQNKELVPIQGSNPKSIWFSVLWLLNFLWKTEKKKNGYLPVPFPHRFSIEMYVSQIMWFYCLLDSSTDTAGNFRRVLLLPCFSGCSYLERKKYRLF